MAVHKSHGEPAEWYILCDDCGCESDPYETRSEAAEDADAVGHLCAECIDLRYRLSGTGRYR